jgi:flagellar assembly protein FliH
MSREAAIDVTTYDYTASLNPEPPSWSALDFAASDVAAEAPAPTETPQRETTASRTEQEIEAEMQRRFEAGRQAGMTAGRTAERDVHEAALRTAENQYRLQLASVAEKFAAAAERHLAEIEQEAADLALAIAARILRREAQLDPLLLTGSVRVALGQLSRGTRARILVPQREVDLWRDALAHIPNLPFQPEIAAGEGLAPGDCRIETELGSVDLGIRDQLAEIERGFFDRIPRSKPPVLSDPEAEPGSTREVVG